MGISGLGPRCFCWWTWFRLKRLYTCRMNCCEIWCGCIHPIQEELRLWINTCKANEVSTSFSYTAGLMLIKKKKWHSHLLNNSMWALSLQKTANMAVNPQSEALKDTSVKHKQSCLKKTNSDSFIFSAKNLSCGQNTAPGTELDHLNPAQNILPPETYSLLLLWRRRHE